MEVSRTFQLFRGRGLKWAFRRVADDIRRRPEFPSWRLPSRKVGVMATVKVLSCGLALTGCILLARDQATAGRGLQAPGGARLMRLKVAADGHGAAVGDLSAGDFQINDLRAGYLRERRFAGSGVALRRQRVLPRSPVE